MSSATLVATYRTLAAVKRRQSLYLGKQLTAVVGKMTKTEKNKCTSLKVRLYEAIILSTLLYNAGGVWPLTAPLTKRLNAILITDGKGAFWKVKVTNEEVRVRTGQHNTDDILSEKKTPLAWTCDTNGSPYHGAYLVRRCSGRFRSLREVQVVGVQSYWRTTVNKDLLWMEITWLEAEVSAQNRLEWCRSEAQCIHWMRVESR